MHPSLQILFDDLEKRRENTLAAFRQYPAEQLNQRPGANQWSAAEVFSHLITAERLSVAYLNKKLPGLHDLGHTGLLEELKMTLLVISQRMPGMKFKAPKRVVESTTLHASLSEIEAAWTSVRQELHGLLDRFPPDGMNRKIYKHPVAGYLNIRQTLRFLREHLIHHRPQLRRLLHP